jgi:hypothetical protein
LADWQSADATVPAEDVGAVDGGCALGPDFFAAQPAAFSPTDNSPLTVQVSISGEQYSEQGFDYSPMPQEGDVVFVDGWELRFSHYIVVLGSVQLNLPGADPTMRSNIGATVARAEGPWIVDLHQRGALTGAGGPPETAVAVTVLPGRGLDPAVRYAFSYRTAPAQCAMQNLNLPAQSQSIVHTMIAQGWTKYIAGTATYRGRAPSAQVDPEFVSFARVVHFSFGMRDSASYVNCHNPELGAQDSAATRGVVLSITGKTRAQITMHTDHSFWDELDVEGTPLHFDPIAARAADFGLMPGGTASVSLDDLQGVSPSMLTTRTGQLVRNRGTMTAGVVDHSPPPSYSVHGAGAVVRDFRDFVIYNTRAQGHLNSDGLCYVQPE